MSKTWTNEEIDKLFSAYKLKAKAVNADIRKKTVEEKKEPVKGEVNVHRLGTLVGKLPVCGDGKRAVAAILSEITGKKIEVGGSSSPSGISSGYIPGNFPAGAVLAAKANVSIWKKDIPALVMHGNNGYGWMVDGTGVFRQPYYNGATRADQLFGLASDKQIDEFFDTIAAISKLKKTVNAKFTESFVAKELVQLRAEAEKK